jgi:hypothetical protein
MTKERVVERVRTVVKGQDSCWAAGTPFPSTATVLCEIKKVTALSGARHRSIADHSGHSSRPANGVGIDRPIDLATKTFAFLKPYADGTKG